MWNKPPVYGFLFPDNRNFCSRLSFSNIINVSLTYLRGLEIEELKEKTIGLKLHSFNEDLDSFTTYYLQE